MGEFVKSQGKDRTAGHPDLRGHFVAYERIAEAEGSLLKIVRAFFPEQAAVDGLGIELRSVGERSAEKDIERAGELLAHCQAGWKWKAKMQTAALISELQFAHKNTGQKGSAEAAEYLSRISKPGDIIFVTGGGKGQGAVAEIIDLLSRIVSSEEPEHLSFPFTHVMINTGKGILDLSPSGAKLRTWEQVFVEGTYYDCVAVGRLQISDNALNVFVAEVENSASSIRDYNMLWPLRFAVSGRERPDSSVDGDKGVCVDYASEAARKLTDLHPEFSGLSQAVLPRDLFEDSSVKIVAALNISRD